MVREKQEKMAESMAMMMPGCEAGEETAGEVVAAEAKDF
jgi:hypothetical protein